MAVITLLNAVELTSGMSIIELDAEPRASNWSVVIPAVRAKPVKRSVKATVFFAVAVDVDASLKAAEPTANIDFSTPSLGIKPIVSVIFDRIVRASSPKSSFNATLT